MMQGRFLDQYLNKWYVSISMHVTWRYIPCPRTESCIESIVVTKAIPRISEGFRISKSVLNQNLINEASNLSKSDGVSVLCKQARNFLSFSRGS